MPCCREQQIQSQKLANLIIIISLTSGSIKLCVRWSGVCVRCAHSHWTFIFYKYQFMCEMVYARLLCGQSDHTTGPQLRAGVCWFLGAQKPAGHVRTRWLWHRASSRTDTSHSVLRLGHVWDRTGWRWQSQQENGSVNRFLAVSWFVSQMNNVAVRRIQVRIGLEDRSELFLGENGSTFVLISLSSESKHMRSYNAESTRLWLLIVLFNILTNFQSFIWKSNEDPKVSWYSKYLSDISVSGNILVILINILISWCSELVS